MVTETSSAACFYGSTSAPVRSVCGESYRKTLIFIKKQTSDQKEQGKVYKTTNAPAASTQSTSHCYPLECWNPATLANLLILFESKASLFSFFHFPFFFPFSFSLLPSPRSFWVGAVPAKFAPSCRSSVWFELREVDDDNISPG